MSTMEQKKSNGVYLSIVQGVFKQSVPAGTEGAVKREWEVGGNSGVKHELEFKGIAGKIIKIGIHEVEADGRNFTNLNVVLDKNKETGKNPIISIKVDSRYAVDIMRKLPNINFDEEVNIRPYSFQPEGEDKNITGVELKQRGGDGQFTEKIVDFFYDKETKESKHGMIVPDADTSTWDTDDWKMYFIKVRKFLVKYTEENICTKFENRKEESEDVADTEKEEEVSTKDVEEDINPDDIPF